VAVQHAASLGTLTTPAARTFGRRFGAPRMAAAPASPPHPPPSLGWLPLPLSRPVDVGDRALDWRRCTARWWVRQPKGIPAPAKLQGNKRLPLLLYVFVDLLLPFGGINPSFQVLFSSIQVLFWQNT
jgi:hypothetical protein